MCEKFQPPPLRSHHFKASRIQVPQYRIHRIATKLLTFAFMLGVLFYCNEAWAQRDRGDRGDRLEDRYTSRLLNRQRKNRPDDDVGTLERFRTIDGSGNNLQNHGWGKAHTNLRRVAGNAYVDGASEPPRGDMPSPRVISNVVFSQSEDIPNSNRLTDMVWQWGQFLDHDIDLTETEK